jgi:hypothetical protein
MNMIAAARVATLAAAMLFAVILPARAADPATADDTAKFLAGMMPSADSPLTPLTRDPAWQRHAKFFDAAFAQLETRQGTGIVFNDYDVGGVVWAVSTAIGWYQQKGLWRRLVQNAMAEDFSWKKQVGEYVRLYERMISAA